METVESQTDPNAAQPISVPTFYFNGFNVGTSFSDMGCVVHLNGIPVAALCMSFTTAKTLANALNNMLTDFERDTDHTIMTMAEVQRRLEST